jgi:hypothetical protein
VEGTAVSGCAILDSAHNANIYSRRISQKNLKLHVLTRLKSLNTVCRRLVE